MQRMFNLDKWERLIEGTALEFINPNPRLVRLEVNAPSKTALHVIDHEGEVHFLALVEGRDTVEFVSSGAFKITVEGADCMLYTADGADISVKKVSHGSFTKIVERRRRDPDLERYMHMMQRNMEMRFEQQAEEYERLLSRRLEAGTVQPPAQSVPATAGTQSAPADGAGTSTDEAASTAGGSEVADGVPA